MQTDAFTHPDPGILLAAALGATLLALAGLILFLGRKHVRWSATYRPEDVTDDVPASDPCARVAPRRSEKAPAPDGERNLPRPAAERTSADEPR